MLVATIAIHRKHANAKGKIELSSNQNHPGSEYKQMAFPSRGSNNQG